MVEYLSYGLHLSISFATRLEHRIEHGERWLHVSRGPFLPSCCLECTCDGRSYGNYFGFKDESYEQKPDKQPYLVPVMSKQFVRVSLCLLNQ